MTYNKGLDAGTAPAIPFWRWKNRHEPATGYYHCDLISISNLGGSGGKVVINNLAK